MRLIHTGDLHIGKVLNEFSLLNDQVHILNQIEEICVKEQANALIISGDVYDRGIPPVQAVKVFDQFITSLSNQGICVLIISGNHDSPERLGFANHLLRENKVFIASEWGMETERVTLKDNAGAVHFHLMPFARAAVLKHYGLEGNHLSEYVAAAVSKIRKSDKTAWENDRNVLVAHYFVTGKGVELMESESEYPIQAGGIDSIDYHCLEGFDYVALGHIHGPQSVAKDTIRYAGSPIKYSFSEAFHEKSVVLIDMESKETIKIKEIKLEPLKDLRMIKGSLAELTKNEIVASCNKEDYLHVTLTDQDEIVDPIGKLRSVYPNVMKLVLEKNIRSDTILQTVDKEMANRSMFERFEEFYQKVTDETMDDKRRQALAEVIQEMEEMEL